VSSASGVQVGAMAKNQLGASSALRNYPSNSDGNRVDTFELFVTQKQT